MPAATCVACGRLVAPNDTRCPTCSAAREGSTHLTPDSGIQAYPQPYPSFPAERGPFLPGRSVVHVVDVRGVWARVTADGAVGWVEGARLLPPIGAAVTHGSPTVRPSTATIASSHQAAIMPDQVIGAVGALGMIIGALVTWTQVFSLNAFKFPVQVLFDNKTHSRDPRLGWFIVVLGALGLAASIVRDAGFWRTLIGLVGVVIVALFFVQIASGLSASIGPFRTHISFNDVVGGGPWITGVAALVLGLSPVFRSRFS